MWNIVGWGGGGGRNRARGNEGSLRVGGGGKISGNVGFS